MIFGEVLEAESIGGFFSGQLIELLLRFSIMSLQNTVNALIWPFHIISLSPVWGALTIGAMYIVFAKFVQAPLEQWLFGDEADTKGSTAATTSEKLPGE